LELRKGRDIYERHELEHSGVDKAKRSGERTLFCMRFRYHHVMNCGSDELFLREERDSEEVETERYNDHHKIG
jgi:hypothetical protein